MEKNKLNWSLQSRTMRVQTEVKSRTLRNHTFIFYKHATYGKYLLLAAIANGFFRIILAIFIMNEAEIFYANEKCLQNYK